jgi:hypothetical protein
VDAPKSAAQYVFPLPVEIAAPTPIAWKAALSMLLRSRALPSHAVTTAPAVVYE